MVSAIRCATLRLAMALAVLALGLVAPDSVASAQPLPDHLSLDILLTNDAHIPAWLLDRATAEAKRIYAKAGIDLIWVTDAPGDPSMRVAILRHAAPEPGVVFPETMAFTLRQPTVIGGMAYVFLDRVENHARYGDVDLGLVLGAVIAHEIGHMLIPGPHAPGGLMRASWSLTDMHQLKVGRLLFSPAEVDVLNARACEAIAARRQPTMLTERTQMQ
jgi:hypothetical protein